MTTQEGNKLIMQFLGFEFVEVDYYDTDGEIK